MIGFGPSRNESDSSPAPQEVGTTNVTTDFIFVDEATYSPGLKALNRRKVRSRARSKAAKILIQKHHTIRLKTESKGLEVLASQERGYGASPLPDNTLQFTIRRRRKRSRSDAHDNLIDTESFLKPAENDSSESQTPFGNDKSQLYSKVYGAKGGLVRTIASPLSRSACLSPRDLLGAGKVDPFFTFPIKKAHFDVHNLVDLYVTNILPGIYPDDNPYQLSSTNTTAKAWISAAIANPFLFNIFLWLITIKRDIMRGSRQHSTSIQALKYKVEGIHQLNSVLSNGKDALIDEIILAVAGLATHEVVNHIAEKRKPFNSPLRKAGLLHTYGGLRMVPEHREAVLRLVALSGGIESLRLKGLAECLVIGEICGVLNSCLKLKPTFPALPLHESYHAAVTRWSRTISTNPNQILGQSFRRLPGCGLTNEMLEVFDYMEAISRAIDYYLQGTPGGLSLGQIIRTRSGIQKRLLLLPTLHGIDPGPSARPNLYECCRLTALIYGVAVIYPIPNTYNVLQTLVRGLIDNFEVMDIESHSVEYFGVLLWMLVLGGIAALDKPERPWFVSNLALLTRGKYFKLDWELAENILGTFLWLESACSPGGRQLWDEVQNFIL